MAAPIVIKAEVSWGANLSALPGTWTWLDITTDLRAAAGVSIHVGRADEDQETGTTEVTFAVNDPLGKYIPRNAYGINWPNVRQNTPFRFTFASGIRVIVFASSYSPSWDESFTFPIVTITASGIMRRHDKFGAFARSAMRNSLSVSSAISYVPMEDAAGSTIAAEGIAISALGHPGTVYGVVDFAGFTQVPPGTKALPDFTGGGQISSTIDFAGLVFLNNSWTMECVFAGPNSVPAADIAVMRWTTRGTLFNQQMTLVANFSPPGISIVGGGPGLSFAVPNLFDGTVRHVRVTADQPFGVGTTTWKLYLDDLLVDTDTSTSTSPGDVVISWVVNNGSLDGYAGNINTVGQVAAFTSALVPGGFGVNDHGRALAGYPAEPALGRIARVCLEQGIAVTITGTSSVVMGPQTVAKTLEIIRACEDTDSGILTDGGTNAGLTYLASGGRYNTTAALSVSTTQMGRPFSPIEDDQRRTNDVVASRTGGGSSEKMDSSGSEGTAAVGTYEDSKTIDVASDDLLPSQAMWRVHLGTVEQMRYPNVVLNLRANPSLVTAWQAVVPGSRITIRDLPVQHMPGDLDLVVEGWQEFSEGEIWTVTINCGSYEPWRVNKVADTQLGRLNTSGSTLTAGVAVNGTSMSVATSAGPLWTTTALFPADFPFTLEIAGIPITVTAIAGTSSPQTFTVTGSTVKKALPINSAVKLYRGGVPGL
jgi:hypothetical protein